MASIPPRKSNVRSPQCIKSSERRAWAVASNFRTDSDDSVSASNSRAHALQRICRGHASYVRPPQSPQLPSTRFRSHLRRTCTKNPDNPEQLNSRKALTPSTPSNLFPKLKSFFYAETHKVSTSRRGGFHVLLHKTFLEQVHSAHASCTAPERVRKWSEFGRK